MDVESVTRIEPARLEEPTAAIADAIADLSWSTTNFMRPRRPAVRCSFDSGHRCLGEGWDAQPALPVGARLSAQAQVINLLARLRRERNLAMLFVAHDLVVVHHVSGSW